MIALALVAEVVMVFADGQREADLEIEEATRRGLTLLDLSDTFAPAPFAEGVPYRETLVALANELDGADEVHRYAEEDSYVELFGIFPSVTVLRGRLADEPRHACHATIDDTALAEAALPLPRGALAATLVMQRHLACDGLLSAEALDGRWGPASAAALGRYRLHHMSPAAGPLDEGTRSLLLLPSRELDFRSLLRALRERVVDATGLIEDGSAGAAWGQVLGRDLDAAEIRDVDGWAPLPRTAPDLVSPATEAAARALGWTDPDAALAALDRLGAGRARPVAVRLPPPPSYDQDVLPLRVEIDRGTYRRSYARRNEPVPRRPSLVLWTDTRDGPLALVRWPTTIGGWQREKTTGGVVRRYKESTPGSYVWRDIVAAPAWFPPPSTPDAELVRRSGGGVVLRQDTIGPGYLSAYGLVMLMHHGVTRARDGSLRYADTAVRTHGSASFRSIRGGSSHGCHRLYNHLALRLAAFVLRHRPHDALGTIAEPYRRRVVAGGKVMWLRREQRGFGLRLLDPVPVEILPGERLP